MDHIEEILGMVGLAGESGWKNQSLKEELNHGTFK
jgi:hypothetical protein